MWRASTARIAVSPQIGRTYINPIRSSTTNKTATTSTIRHVHAGMYRRTWHTCAPVCCNSHHSYSDIDTLSKPHIYIPGYTRRLNTGTTLCKKAGKFDDDGDSAYTQGLGGTFSPPQGTMFWKDKQTFYPELGGHLKGMTVGYESWGEINADHTNCILLCTGLSSHSHAASSERNTNPGWWEKFIGPGKALDTNKFFVVCTNVLGSCYGTTGPSSINPETGKHYATDFPAITVADMVKLQMRFLSEKFSIFSLHAAVGSSLGGMQSLAVAAEFGPERVGRVVSISACAQSHPTSIAIRYAQRRCIVTDPNWQHGHFYDTESYPSVGMKTARIMGTISYRSGPEWLKRFKNNRIDEDKHMGEPHGSGFGPDFMIEAYLSHQSESFATRYDPNSILYISKAMDMFDLGRGFGSLSEGLQRIKVPTLVLGVQSDILFPVFQQKQIAQLLREGGNKKVTYYELDAIYGHDTFLLDVKNVGGAVKGHIEHNLSSAAEQYKASGC